MLKNQELAEQVFASLDTAIEAEEQLLQYANQGKIGEFAEVSSLLLETFSTIEKVSGELVQEERALSLDKAIPSIIDSINRIIKLFVGDYERSLMKIEFELIPLTEECRLNFYYWGMVFGDKEKERVYLEKDIHELDGNKYVEESVRTGEWKYDLSIMVLSYNKLDYTKKCIESLMRNYPRGLRTELILVNHGSTDGTKEYFEEINPDKQIDILINGGGMLLVHRIVEGKYLLSISNDVFVQRNAIRNMYECMTSDSTVGFVVPTTPNVSNLQTIPLSYNSEEELKKVVKKNNILNSDRWEQRTRLCDPISMVSTAILAKHKPSARFFSKNVFSFPDDAFSLLCRRNGYKMFLLKDSFCHHCGSITLKSDAEVSSLASYNQGRERFFLKYGIDPWYKCCYSAALFGTIEVNKRGQVNILAVNGGYGSNGLKIKELLKENVSNTSVYLKYLLTDEQYYEDVRYLGNQVEIVDSIMLLKSDINLYDYLVVEDIDFSKFDFEQVLIMSYKKCRKDALLIIEVTNEVEYNHIGAYGSPTEIEENDRRKWLVYKVH